MPAGFEALLCVKRGGVLSWIITGAAGLLHGLESGVSVCQIPCFQGSFSLGICLGEPVLGL